MFNSAQPWEIMINHGAVFHSDVKKRQGVMAIFVCTSFLALRVWSDPRSAEHPVVGCGLKLLMGIPVEEGAGSENAASMALTDTWLCDFLQIGDAGRSAIVAVSFS